MPLPSGVIPLSTGGSGSKSQAYLFRPSQEAWTKLQASASGITVDFQGDDITLNIPGSAPIPLTSQASSSASELFTLSQNQLKPLAVASSRLTIPIGPSGSSKPSQRLQAQPKATVGQRRDSFGRVNGSNGDPSPRNAALAGNKGVAMGRTASSPGMGTGTASPQLPSASGSREPIIPLKTRVIQALALGPISLASMEAKLGISEADIMRVVRVVGKDLGNGDFTLQASKYSQIKIADWKYSHAEKLLIIRRAREAFDELGLPSDAEERTDLRQKESEINASAPTEAEVVEQVATPDHSDVPLPRAADLENVSTPLSSPQLKATPGSGGGGSGSGSKKSKKSLGLIGKERAKFAAQQQQRASSLPGAKRTNGSVASPRLDPTTKGSLTPIAKSSSKATSPRPGQADVASEAKTNKTPTNGKRKREEDDKSKRKRNTSPAESSAGTTTSSNSDRAHGSTAKTQGRGRDKTLKPLKATPLANGHRGRDKKSSTRDYSSSSGSDGSQDSESGSGATPLSGRKALPDEHPRSSPLPASAASQSGTNMPSFKRKAPPPELELEAKHSNAATRDGLVAGESKKAGRRPTEEELRDRYEELFPAYQLYTRKLVKIQQAVDEGEEGEVMVDQEEIGRMVKKWEKWHRELEDIRKWFGDAEG